MFAVVKIGGQQFRVEKGQTIFVPKIADDKTSNIPHEVLLVSNQDKVSFGKDIKQKIQFEFVKTFQGDKVLAFKMKRRKGFRKLKGHRTQYSQLKVKDIA